MSQNVYTLNTQLTEYSRNILTGVLQEALATSGNGAARQSIGTMLEDVEAVKPINPDARTKAYTLNTQLTEYSRSIMSEVLQDALTTSGNSAAKQCIGKILEDVEAAKHSPLAGPSNRKPASSSPKKNTPTV